MNGEILNLSKALAGVLKEKKYTLATAESCTGGLLAGAITAIAGSSTYFDRGFIAYSNDAKIETLGVKSETLVTFGAVSNETALEMAQGALAHSNANLAIAITGIAGPQGATEQKPLGMVSFAAVAPKNRIRNSTKYFKGNREQIRTQAVIFALELLLAITNNS